jgi:hypothetical protein
MDKLIDSVNGLDTTKITVDSLNWKYGTGRSYTEKNGSEKICRYRHGVMTDAGDIRVDVWEKLVLLLIKRDGEELIHEQLSQWYQDTLGALWSEEDLRLMVLKAHTARLYDSPQWRDYMTFNQKYRPWVLKKPEEC